MTILAGDIKLFESDTMDDTIQGGGAMTGNVIVDGLSNNIFEDVSTLDRTYGAVNMRKTFPAVATQNQDKYFGSHAIISRLPKDEQIGVHLFDTGDWFDRRVDAKTRVENYLAKGAKYDGVPWSTQWKDSKILTIIQSVSAPTPGVGDVLYLTQFDESETQFVKIVAMAMEVRTFTDGSGVYEKRVLSLEISQGLNYDFFGREVVRYIDYDPDKTQIRTTVVANAAKYYSARPISDAIAIDDMVVTVDSVYSQVIPSSLTETAIAGADLNGEVPAIFDSADGAVSRTTSIIFSELVNIYLGTPVLPGSLSIPVSGGTLTDSDGNIKSGTTTVGTIDYLDGILRFAAGSPTYSGTKVMTFRPACAPTKVADTAMMPVTAANRGLVWVLNLGRQIMSGSLRVSYRALDNWYTLYDNGTGSLSGREAGIGTGDVDYAAGSVSLSLSALPDAGSAIIFSSGVKSRIFNRAGSSSSKLKLEHTLSVSNVRPGSITVTWTDVVAKTATDNGAGLLTGDATGTIDYVLGKIAIQPDTLPAAATEFDIAFGVAEVATRKSEVFAAPVLTGGGLLSLALPDTNILADSVRVTWNVEVDEVANPDAINTARFNDISGNMIAIDNAAGGLVYPSGAAVPSGTVNYAAGTLAFDPATTMQGNIPTWSTVEQPLQGGFTQSHPVKFSTDVAAVAQRVITNYTPTALAAVFPQTGSGTVTVDYQLTNTDDTHVDTIISGAPVLYLVTDFDAVIVPGSVGFVYAGMDCFDVNGSIYHSLDHSDGTAIHGGTIDYATGMVSFSNWADGMVNGLTINSLAVEVGKEPLGGAVFRIPNAPVKVDSVQIRGTTLNGDAIVGTPDSSGLISTGRMQGWCDYRTGVVQVLFGQWVVAAGNEGEDWYNPDLVADDGTIFKGETVFASTMEFDAVSQTFLPMDESILGLNPVRLPQDGRVPIYAKGDVVVILNDQITSATYTSSTTTDLGRVRLSKVTIKDSVGDDLLVTKYTVDLTTGIISWGDLAGVSQPLTIVNRIEDMSVLSDVEITGDLTLTKPVSHNFPVQDTLVSNAVIYGDQFAHTSIPFDQEIWLDEWSDVLMGLDVAAQYNNSQYPITVDNASCIEERWMAVFTTPTTVNIIGENSGQILSAVSILTDIAPINPNTAQAYFTIPLDGWGAGWAAGNLVRFNTKAANKPLWVIRSVGQGDATDTDLTFCVEIRGDIDTP